MHIKARPTPQIVYGLFSHSLKRKLNLTYPDVVKDLDTKQLSDLGEIKAALLRATDEILRTAPRVVDGEVVRDWMARRARSDIFIELNYLASEIYKKARDTGLMGRSLASLFSPWGVEVDVESRKLDLKGRVDKVEFRDGRYIPVEIKTGAVGRGIWREDQLQVGAYAMLFEETFGTTVEEAIVEYTRVGERRKLKVDDELRDSVRRQIETTKEILAMADPPEICQDGNGKKCSNCRFYELCFQI